MTKQELEFLLQNPANFKAEINSVAVVSNLVNNFPEYRQALLEQLKKYLLNDVGYLRKNRLLTRGYQ